MRACMLHDPRNSKRACADEIRIHIYEFQYTETTKFIYVKETQCTLKKFSIHIKKFSIPEYTKNTKCTKFSKHIGNLVYPCILKLQTFLTVRKNIYFPLVAQYTNFTSGSESAFYPPLRGKEQYILKLEKKIVYPVLHTIFFSTGRQKIDFFAFQRKKKCNL